MLGWLIAVVALGALVFDPGLGGRVVAAAAVLAYLLLRSGREPDDSAALDRVTEIEPDEESHWSVRPPGWFGPDGPGSSAGDVPGEDEEAP